MERRNYWCIARSVGLLEISGRFKNQNSNNLANNLLVCPSRLIPMQEVKTTHRVWHTCCLCKAHNVRLRYTCRYFGARAGHLASQLRSVLEILPRAKRGIENQPALTWETVNHWQSCGEVFRLRFKIHFPLKFPSRENWNSSTLESTWTHQSIISLFSNSLSMIWSLGL